ncbi:ATP-binding cassette domain-containing protein [Streptomyces sp. NPDC048258]|uniref:ABC transporter ATP-binding protein n=1 Tax=Streptomyces sp. NPDC048258 TaxID=3365527 RepID=UPI00371DBFA0
MTPLLEMSDLWYAYPHAGRHRDPVLRGVQGCLYEGETLAVVGRNGSGKSTLLKILATVLRPTSGHLLHRGRRLGPAPARYRAGVGYSAGAPQGFYPRLTAVENIRFFSGMKGRMHSAQEARHLLARVGLSDSADTTYATFSLGMRQRLHLARLLLEPSQLWIIDEPTNGLDGDGLRLLEALLAETPGKTKVVVSHDEDFLARVATRTLVLDRGRVT